MRKGNGSEGQSEEMQGRGDNMLCLRSGLLHQLRRRQAGKELLQEVQAHICKRVHNRYQEGGRCLHNQEEGGEEVQS